MTLYELTGAMKDFELEVDENGEITNMDELESIEMARQEKIENLCLYIKNLRAESVALAGEIKGFQYRKKMTDNKVDRLMKYLGDCLEGEEYKSPKAKVTYKKTSVVSCEDPLALESRFQRVKVEADKTAIKNALKSGEEVTGAHLEENVSVILK